MERGPEENQLNLENELRRALGDGKFDESVRKNVEYLLGGEAQLAELQRFFINFVKDKKEKEHLKQGTKAWIKYFIRELSVKDSTTSFRLATAVEQAGAPQREAFLDQMARNIESGNVNEVLFRQLLVGTAKKDSETFPDSHVVQALNLGGSPVYLMQQVNDILSQMNTHIQRNPEDLVAIGAREQFYYQVANTLKSVIASDVALQEYQGLLIKGDPLWAEMDKFLTSAHTHLGERKEKQIRGTIEFGLKIARENSNKRDFCLQSASQLESTDAVDVATYMQQDLQSKSALESEQFSACARLIAGDLMARSSLLVANLSPKDYILAAQKKKKVNTLTGRERQVVEGFLNFGDSYNKIGNMINNDLLNNSSSGQHLTNKLALYIEVARQSYEMGDYNSALAIQAAISSVPIYNLKGVWAQLPSNVMETHKQNTAILDMSVNKNYAQIRADMANRDRANEFFIPAMAPFMGDADKFTEQTFVGQANNATSTIALLERQRQLALAGNTKPSSNFLSYFQQISAPNIRADNSSASLFASVPMVPDKDFDISSSKLRGGRESDVPRDKFGLSKSVEFPQQKPIDTSATKTVKEHTKETKKASSAPARLQQPPRTSSMSRADSRAASTSGSMTARSRADSQNWRIPVSDALARIRAESKSVESAPPPRSDSTASTPGVWRKASVRSSTTSTSSGAETPRASTPAPSTPASSTPSSTGSGWTRTTVTRRRADNPGTPPPVQRQPSSAHSRADNPGAPNDAMIRELREAQAKREQRTADTSSTSSTSPSTRSAREDLHQSMHDEPPPAQTRNRSNARSRLDDTINDENGKLKKSGWAPAKPGGKKE